MKTRLLFAILSASLLILIPVTAFAKGQFAVVVITGGSLTGEVRSADPALTDDFFAFADFSSGATDKPTDPGIGYEITRVYIDNGNEIAFDRLQYYPASAYVYYDGIVNGSSEYDGKWYKANPAVEHPFQAALAPNAHLTLTPFAISFLLAAIFVFAFAIRPREND